MNLLIDVGNTSLKCCTFKDLSGYKRRSVVWAIENMKFISTLVYAQVAESDELRSILTSANKQGVKIIEASVTPEMFGVSCGYNNYETLGIDHWLAVLAAARLYKNHDVLVVDSGTALTVDVVTENGNHIGGWITPGLQLMQQSIIEKAPGVFGHETHHNEHFGTSTPSALYHGCVNALVGAIEMAKGHLQGIEFHASENLKIVLTGGDAPILASFLKMPVHVEPNLVFIGLNRFAEPSD
mgnify:CR=1 FL=1